MPVVARGPSASSRSRFRLIAHLCAEKYHGRRSGHSESSRTVQHDSSAEAPALTLPQNTKAMSWMGTMAMIEAAETVSVTDFNAPRIV